jgi:uncharacterized membrane protein YjfL (UPF0719 family)
MAGRSESMNVGSYLITCLAGGVMGVVLFLVGFKLFDMITPEWVFQEAFSGSLVVAAYLLGLAIIISRVAS